MDRGKQRLRLRQASRRRRTRRRPVLVGDRVEPGDPAEPDDALEVAQLLCDPEADVGRAGDQRRVRKTLVERSEPVEARGRGEEAPSSPTNRSASSASACERRGALLGVAAKRSSARRRRSRAPPRGSGDSRCSGRDCRRAGRRGSAAVARRPGMVGREQAHHDARRAEAALRAVMIDHRLLDRVQRLAVGEILDRDEFRAVELAEEQDAGVDRLVGQLARLAARPSTTVQAPQSPSAQPSFVPVAACSSRSQSSTVARGENRSSRDLAAAEPEAQRVASLGRAFLQTILRFLRSRLYDGAFAAKRKRRGIGEGPATRAARGSRSGRAQAASRKSGGTASSTSASIASSAPMSLRVRAEAAHRDRVLGRLLAADGQQHRNLRQRVLAHLVVDLLVAQIDLDPQPRFLALAANSSAKSSASLVIVQTTIWTGASHSGRWPA